MSSRNEKLGQVFQDLTVDATHRGKQIHDSFFVELGNYSKHDVVCELSVDQLKVVIQGIGREALKSPDQRVGAGHVRHVIIELCGDPFSPCDSAATKILNVKPRKHEGNA